MEPLTDINGVLNELSPFIYILQFLGFFYNVPPDGIKNLRQLNFRCFDFGLRCILSNVLIIELSLLTFGYVIIHTLLLSKYWSLIDKLVVTFITIGLECLPSFINWIMSIRNSKKFIAIFTEISKLDAKCEWWTPGARPIKKTKIFVVIWLIVIIMQTILVTLKPANINLYVVYYIASVVYFFMFIKIGCVMELILFRMKLQNSHIFLLESKLSSLCMLDADPVGAGEIKNLINSHRNYHLKLIMIIKQLNSVHSLEILMNMVLNFLVMYFNSFYAMIFLCHIPGVVNYKVSFHVFLGVSFAATLAIINFIYICNTSHGLIQEVKRTPRLISELALYTSDEDVLDELKRFSIQLVLTPVKITASGLFELDNSTILSIFSTLTTNIVIMIQVSIINKDRS